MTTEQDVPQAAPPAESSTTREVFLSFLTREQRKSTDRHGYFFTRGQSGIYYRILVGSGLTGNVRALRCSPDDDDSDFFFEVHLCCHTHEIWSSYLTQVLYLRHDEQKFLRIANEWTKSTADVSVWPSEAVEAARSRKRRISRW